MMLRTCRRFLRLLILRYLPVGQGLLLLALVLSLIVFMNLRQSLGLLNDLNVLLQHGIVTEEHLGELLVSMEVSVRDVQYNADYLDGFIQGLRLADSVDKDVVSCILAKQ